MPDEEEKQEKGNDDEKTNGDPSFASCFCISWSFWANQM